MTSGRNIARELLPYVVLVWATFALLGGTMKHAEHTGAVDEGPDAEFAIEAGAGLCAITTAYLLKAAAGRIRPLLRRFFRLARPLLVPSAAPGPVAYHRPPPSPPSLARLQILRT